MPSSALTEQVQAVYPCKSTARHTEIHLFRFRFDDNSLLLSSIVCTPIFEILCLCKGTVNLSGYAECILFLRLAYNNTSRKFWYTFAGNRLQATLDKVQKHDTIETVLEWKDFHRENLPI